MQQQNRSPDQWIQIQFKEKGRRPEYVRASQSEAHRFLESWNLWQVQKDTIPSVLLTVRSSDSTKTLFAYPSETIQRITMRDFQSSNHR